MTPATPLHAVRACPHAGEWVGCPCARVRRCRRYDKDVSTSECLRCVRDAANASPPAREAKPTPE